MSRQIQGTTLARCAGPVVPGSRTTLVARAGTRGVSCLLTVYKPARRPPGGRVAASPCLGEILPAYYRVTRGAAPARRAVYASGVPDRRLSRLRPAKLAENPWLRTGLLAVGLAVYGLASQWTQVHAALARLAGYDVAGAAASVIAGLGAMLMAWRALLADLGSALPLPAAIRVMFIGQLGKYVPGAVWALAAKVELAR